MNTKEEIKEKVILNVCCFCKAYKRQEEKEWRYSALLPIGNNIEHNHVFCPKCEKEIYRNELDYENVKVVDFNAPKWAFFFETSGCLSHKGYERLKTAFEAYAKAYSLDAINVLSNLVSPNVFEEMMKIFVKERQEGKSER